MQLQKKDFIEIEFTGKIKDTEQIFDSNIKEDLGKINPELKPKPLIYCLGEDMFLKGVDDFLIGKEIGKHKIELKPENAFGKRDAKLVQMIPMKIFIQHKINPVQGVMLNFDGRMGKVLSVSGGRVLIDFNHPVAGREVIYDIDVKRKVENINEKIKAFNEFTFGKELRFKIGEKKVIYELDKKDENLKKFLEMFKDKFKQMFNMDFEVKGDKEEKKKKEKKEEVKSKEVKEEKPAKKQGNQKKRKEVKE